MFSHLFCQQPSIPFLHLPESSFIFYPCWVALSSHLEQSIAISLILFLKMMNLQHRHLRTEFQKSYYFVSMNLQNHYFQQSLQNSIVNHQNEETIYSFYFHHCSNKIMALTTVYGEKKKERTLSGHAFRNAKNLLSTSGFCKSCSNPNPFNLKPLKREENQ